MHAISASFTCHSIVALATRPTVWWCIPLAADLVHRTSRARGGPAPAWILPRNQDRTRRLATCAWRKRWGRPPQEPDLPILAQVIFTSATWRRSQVASGCPTAVSLETVGCASADPCRRIRPRDVGVAVKGIALPERVVYIYPLFLRTDPTGNSMRVSLQRICRFSSVIFHLSCFRRDDRNG